MRDDRLDASWHNGRERKNKQETENKYRTASDREANSFEFH